MLDKKEAQEFKSIFYINSRPQVATLPEIKEKQNIDVRYVLLEPFAYAHIYWDKINNELVYEIEEPKLDDKEKEVLNIIENGINELINISFIGMKNTDVVIEYLEKNIRVLLNELKINITKETYLKLMYYIYRDFVGLNEIEPMLKDYYIEDIECNGVNSPIYIVHRKYRNIRTNIIFKDIRKLTSFVEKLAQKSGKYISYATPLLDASLPDGSRINATFTQDISSKGPSFCFADGYLQLNNGEVIKIDKLFEKCRNNFGSKIENENEIVEIENIKCCGVDENTLKQINSKLKTIIRLKAPEKLAKIEFEDGSDIITTTNHLFHVADSKLNLIEAEKLNKNMFIPTPYKITVEGCLQNINILDLIKEFSYLYKTCLISTQEIKDIVTNNIEKFKTPDGEYRTRMAQEYEVHNSYFYEIISRGNSISFEVLNKMCSFNSLNDPRLIVYGGGSKNCKKEIKIPKTVDEDLAYLAGAVISDGHLSKNSVDISCFEEGFRDAVISKLINKFGKCNSHYNNTRIYLCSLFSSFFFNKVFNIPYGNKARIVGVPEIIFKSNNKIIASFIKGLFDGDGTCRGGLSYKTFSKKLAEELTYLLARLGIYSVIKKKNNEYKILIPSIYEIIYAEKIGFYNKFKIICLNNLLSKKYSSSKSYIRHGRVPAKPVLELMKKVGLSKNKVSKICKTSYSRLVRYDSLAKPFVRQIISLIETEIKNKNLSIDLEYIKWLVNCEQEFGKIKNVEIFENKEKIPVYDIELEPCKFFIAGNKPMNIFDTVRRFTSEPWGPIKLMQMRTVSPEILAYLWIAIENESNIMIIGGTGTGKTTFLNTIAFFIPPAARIVSIEDTKEINLMHENWLPSITREGMGISNLLGTKEGEITLFDLLRESFRQRPDYVIVGEVRGKEAYVLFQGMSSLRGDEEIFILKNNKPLRIKIKEIENLNIKELKTISYDVESKKYEILPIRAFVKHPKRNILYKVTTKLGRSITVTPDHSLFTLKENKISEIKTDELTIGSNIIIPSSIPSGYNNISYIDLFEYLPDIRVYAPEYIKEASHKLGYYEASSLIGCISITDYYSNFKRSKPSAMKAEKFLKLMSNSEINFDVNKLEFRYDKKSKSINGFLEINDNFLKLLGYYLSEGSLDDCKGNSSIALYNKKESVLEDMRKCIIELTGLIPNERITKGYGSCLELSFNHKVLFEFIKIYCKKKQEKKVPDFIFGLDKRRIGVFLSALYCGDGTIKQGHFDYYTTSKNLANDVTQLLLVYGIAAVIRKRNRPGRKTTDYEIKFYSSYKKEEFLKYIKPIGKEIDLKIFNKKDNNLLGDLYCDKIKSIEILNLDESEYVYDISVPKNQNFIGGFGSILAHNSGHPSFGTMHAEDVETLVRRLETPPIELSPALVESLDVVCVIGQVKIQNKETRRIKEVVEIVKVKEGVADIETNTPFVWDPRTDNFFFKEDSKLFDKIVLHKGISREKLNKEFLMRTKLLMALYKNNIFGFKEVNEIINAYYKTPELVLKKFNIS